MSGWTDLEIELITALWTSGNSASQIVNALRAKGFTARSRNAVIGKLTRLNVKRPTLTPSATSLATRLGRKDYQPPKPAKPKPAKVERTTNGVPVPLPAPEPIGGAGLPLLALERHQCRWATGHDGEQHLFCGNRAAPGSPYCPHHGALAIAKVQPDAPKRRDAFAPSWRAA